MNEILSKRVYTVVEHIPRGRVMTYGMVARLANIRNPRLVGMYLHRNPDPRHIPCHRVVNAKGMCSFRYAFGGRNMQEKRLQTEGIRFHRHSVDLHIFGVSS